MFSKKGIISKYKIYDNTNRAREEGREKKMFPKI